MSGLPAPPYRLAEPTSHGAGAPAKCRKSVARTRRCVGAQLELFGHQAFPKSMTALGPVTALPKSSNTDAVVVTLPKSTEKPPSNCVAIGSASAAPVGT